MGGVRVALEKGVERGAKRGSEARRKIVSIGSERTRAVSNLPRRPRRRRIEDLTDLRQASWSNPRRGLLLLVIYPDDIVVRSRRLLKIPEGGCY